MEPTAALASTIPREGIDASLLHSHFIDFVTPGAHGHSTNLATKDPT